MIGGSFLEGMLRDMQAQSTLDLMKKHNIGLDDLSAARVGLADAQPKTKAAVIGFINALAQADATGKEGRDVFADHVERLERDAANLERRSGLLKLLQSKTAAWITKMGSFAAIADGISELTTHANTVIEMDIQAQGELTDWAAKNPFADLTFEKAEIVAIQFDTDAQAVVRAGLEFAHRFGRGATMQDLEGIAATARAISMPIQQTWNLMVKRQQGLGGLFADALYSVQSTLRAQHELEVALRQMGTPKELILGAADFANVVSSLYNTIDGLPRDATLVSRFISFALQKAAKSGVRTKAGQTAIAEDMGKILAADPFVQQQVGDGLIVRIRADTDRIVASHDGKYDRSKAEFEAVHRIFGDTYSQEVQYWLHARADGMESHHIRQNLGRLYAQVPAGMRETAHYVQQWAVQGGSGQDAEAYFASKGVRSENIPLFVRMALDGDLEKAADAAENEGSLAADRRDATKLDALIVDRTRPSSIPSYVEAAFAVVTHSPWVKIVGGLGALAATWGLERWQNASLRRSLSGITRQIQKLSSGSSAIPGALGEAGQVAGTIGRSGGKFARLAQFLGGPKMRKVLLGAAALGAAAAAVTPLLASHARPTPSADNVLGGSGTAPASAVNAAFRDGAENTIGAVNLNSAGAKIVEARSRPHVPTPPTPVPAPDDSGPVFGTPTIVIENVMTAFVAGRHAQ